GVRSGPQQAGARARWELAEECTEGRLRVALAAALASCPAWPPTRGRGFAKDRTVCCRYRLDGARGGEHQRWVGLGGHSADRQNEGAVAGGHGKGPDARHRLLSRFVPHAALACRQVRGRTEVSPGTGAASRISPARASDHGG